MIFRRIETRNRWFRYVQKITALHVGRLSARLNRRPSTYLKYKSIVKSVSKKERYFTPENIQAKTLEIFTSVQDYRLSHGNLRFHPDRAALLVLDMQEYFLSEASHAFIPSAPAIIPNIQFMIKVFAVYNRPIFFTRHVNTEENAGIMGKWWKDLIYPQTAHSHFIKHLDTSKGIILPKSQYDAFYETPLENYLRASEVGEVVISGVMTHLCCETTARSAFMRGFEVFFAIDGTATYNESFHRATLLNLAHGFAIPVQVEEILSAFSLINADSR